MVDVTRRLLSQVAIGTAGPADGRIRAVRATTSFRAVVTDLDGTVVNDGEISAVTIRAAAELADRGIALIAATGRTPNGIAALEALVPYLTAAVCCGGAIGWSPASGEVLWQENIDARSVGHLIRFTDEHLPGAGIAAHDGQRWRMTQAYAEQRGSTRLGRTEVVPAAELVNHRPCSMSICHPTLTSDELLDLLGALGIESPPSMTYSMANLVDIVPARISKHSGVSRTLAALDISPADAIVFGDMPNDLPMFELCGHAVAVANAHPSVLAAAATVARCVHDDGVPRLLTELGLIGGDPTFVAARQPSCRTCSPIG